MSETRNGEPASLADRLLRQACDTHRPMSVYLTSGFQLKGQVIEFDSDTLLFKQKETYQLVMRPAVATMYPLPSKEDGEEWWRAYVPTIAPE